MSVKATKQVVVTLPSGHEEVMSGADAETLLKALERELRRTSSPPRDPLPFTNPGPKPCTPMWDPIPPATCGAIALWRDPLDALKQ